jgi:hypothetical protein
MAAQEGRTNVCEVILASGFPIDLSTALRLGKRDLVKKMIKEKPSMAKEVEEDSDLWGNTSPLGVAASQGEKEIVVLLLKAGAPVDAVTRRPNAGPTTALCNAVWAGHYEIAEILCNAGADCNMSGGKFYPRLLDYASKHSDKKMINLLVKHGAKPSGPDPDWLVMVGKREFGLRGYESKTLVCYGVGSFFVPLHVYAATAIGTGIPLLVTAIYIYTSRRRRH